MGLKSEPILELEKSLGGRGCVLKDGVVVHAWGDQSERSDWLSSAKPVLSTLLFFAIEEGKVKSVDQPIADFGWDLKEKDRGITFRHLGAMSSGYARPEGPGEAWAYNDFAINLYQQTLFDKVFQADPKQAAEDPARLGALGLEDGLSFRESNRRLSASVRDFARIAWFWMNRGKWGDKQVLPEKYFEEYRKPQTPKDLPQTQEAETDDYLGIGTYGGGSDHFTVCGPGIYGFNWWFNDTGRQHPESRTWPSAPEDAFMSIGAGGNCAAMLPSQGLAVIAAKADWGKLKAGVLDTRINRNFELMMQALQED
jgi:CubicO group peptidase (beta-lactamase class C family)